MLAEDPLRAVQTVAFIVVFCLTFRGGVAFGVDKRHNDAKKIATAVRDSHLGHLEACSKAELTINQFRIVSGVEPLPTEYFCRRAP